MELKGKKILFLGDSITEGCGASDVSKCFVSLIAEREEATCVNYGIGGTRIARQTTPSAEARWDLDYISRVPGMDAEADAVVVFGGTNDYGHATIPLGTFEDRDIHTFYGGMHTLCLYLIKNYTDKEIVFMTPLHRLQEVKLENDVSRPLHEFVKAIREVCEYYSIPVCDMYKESGMYGNVWAWCEKYMPDGLHPNDEGHKLIARKLQKFLENL